VLAIRALMEAIEKRDDDRKLTEVASSDPVGARRVMAEVVESVVLRFTDDEPEAQVTLKLGTAAIAGGPVLEKVSCGGVQQAWESPAPGPVSFFMPRLRGARF
jgi:hypothetical protein